MKILIHLILLLPILLSGRGLPAISRHDTKTVAFTIRDPQGNPVEGALLEASKPGPGGAKASSGKDGKARLELVASATLYLYVSKDGYYRTGGRLWQGGMHKGPDGQLVARTLPDHFDIELKPVRNPVPMIEMQYAGSCPLTGRPVPFDLAVGDWAAPYGKGKRADLYFNFHDLQSTHDAYSGVLTLLFPGPADGIQPFQAARPHSVEFGSNQAPPNEAPLEGYSGELRLASSWKAGQPAPYNVSSGKNYLFRVRSREDPQGRLREACYGWIQGEIEFDPRGLYGPQLRFRYEFNPDPDPEARSLENQRTAP